MHDHFLIKIESARLIAQNCHITKPSTNQMWDPQLMISVKYWKNQSINVGQDAFFKKFTAFINKQINKQDCPRTMTQLIKRKLFVILKVRNSAIIDGVVIKSFIIREKNDSGRFAISYDIPNGVLSGVSNGVLNPKWYTERIPNGEPNSVQSGVLNGVLNDVLHGIPNGVLNDITDGFLNSVQSGVPEWCSELSPEWRLDWHL